MSDGDAPPEARFAAALVELEDELDWALLERAYCEGEPDGAFFSAEQRAAQRDAGLALADELARALRGRPGRSLYVGAGVGELAPLLLEVLVLGREATVVSLAGPEPDELNRALAAVEARIGLALPRWRTEPLARVDVDGADHLWFASVLTDPDAFPALHAHLYGRGKPPRDRRRAEEARAAALLADALRRVAPPAVLTTTDEERDLFEAAAAERGLRLEWPERGRLSAIVGDALRHARIVRA